MHQPVELAVDIVRFEDDCQPGIVACEFTDASGQRHTVIDKVPIFTCIPLDGSSKYPQPGTARCTVLTRWRDEGGRELVNISTAKPDGIESSEGLSEFVVLFDQIQNVR